MSKFVRQNHMNNKLQL